MGIPYTKLWPSRSEGFQGISAIDSFERESRPVFVVDLEKFDHQDSARVDPVYWNEEFGQLSVLDEISKTTPFSSYTEEEATSLHNFKSWLLEKHEKTSSIRYGEFTWTALVIRQRWKAVFGSAIPQPFNSSMGNPAVVSRRHSRESSVTDMTMRPETLFENSFDFTSSLPLPPGAPSHIEFARNVDWASTLLGPTPQWSTHLRHLSNLCISSQTHTVLFWGPKKIVFYSESYIPILGSLHPECMGKPIMEAFCDAALEATRPIMNEFVRGRIGRTFEDLQLFQDRGVCDNEETYFTYSYQPVVGDTNDGSACITAWWLVPTETTNGKLTERRLSTLASIGERTALAKNLKSFWTKVFHSLEANGYDVPFAAVYSVTNPTSTDPSSPGLCRKRFQLEGAIGVPADYSYFPNVVHQLTDSLEDFTGFFLQAAETRESLVVRTADGTLPTDFVEGLILRGFKETPQAAVVCAIRPTALMSEDPDTVMGFLIMGLNTRRPYDQNYSSWIQSVVRQINTSAASVVLFEQEIQRGASIAEQAAMDKGLFEAQLNAKVQEIEQSEQTLKRIFTSLPVGIFWIEFTPEYPLGESIFRNDEWFRLTGDERTNTSQAKTPLWPWIHPDDAPILSDTYQAVLVMKELRTIQYRIRPGGRGSEEDLSCYTTLLLSMFPLFDDAGKLKSMLGSATDISAQKKIERLQNEQIQDAITSKRNLENFIDVTSHEMRNPLGAIIISSDDLMETLHVLQTHESLTASELQSVRSCLEAAHTIRECARHQKQIADDILTISKLESGLFAITPGENRPVALIEDVLRMHHSEFESANIIDQIEILETVRQLGIDWVYLDPSRVKQVLINLLTNAIKFTKDSERRLVYVRLSAFLDPPLRSDDVEYLPKLKEREDTTNSPEWGDGQIVYLQFTVQDTGKGLSPDEKKILFVKFSQAPKTHVSFGGSGLGLWISRELTEMHGGYIGVGSDGAGLGSTFTFYIKTRRAKAPPEAVPLPITRRRPHLSSYDSSIDYLPIVDSEASDNGQSPEYQKHILLVEDNLVNQKVFSKQLRKHGYAVSIANHGQEALDYLATTDFWHPQRKKSPNLTNQPYKPTTPSTTPWSSASPPPEPPPRSNPLDLILLDLEMPVLDGTQTIKTIRQLEREGQIVRHVPVIAVTANARLEQKEQALEAGMDDVVCKPFRVVELVKVMEGVIGGEA
ncbi:hypothetical protein K402DRAFT_131530 [Aulographum hederae CBS 113979]|uniref:Uncharacterized protein n=1 Tax=Aulographum hederae CBS 113979 TaxID=1176131 RepID=A0A6G1HF69_9PEZI|nr:hypothetical protein K402DRAFT_131530 [Aulographum hederae CBS 113979]